MKMTLAMSLLIGLASNAYADDYMMGNNFNNGPKLYVGASAGSSKLGDTCNDPFFSGNCNDQDFAWKAFGGARLNPMTGVELTYYDLGSSSMNGTTGAAALKWTAVPPELALLALGTCHSPHKSKLLAKQVPSRGTIKPVKRLLAIPVNKKMLLVRVL